MVSTYEYITLAELESDTGIDYSTVDTAFFTDAAVDLTITLAERRVNGYLGVSSKQSVTDAIKSATLTIAGFFMDNQMKHRGYHKDTPFVTINIEETLEFYLGSDRSLGVSAIPMYGADK